VPAGTTHEKLLSSFSLACSGSTATGGRAITSDSVRLFALTRDATPRSPASRAGSSRPLPGLPPGPPWLVHPADPRERRRAGGGQAIATVLRITSCTAATHRPAVRFACGRLAGALSGLVRRRRIRSWPVLPAVTFSAVILLSAPTPSSSPGATSCPVVIMLPWPARWACTAVAAPLLLFGLPPAIQVTNSSRICGSGLRAQAPGDADRLARSRSTRSWAAPVRSKRPGALCRRPDPADAG